MDGYLTKPTTRLARYPLLLEAILKHTPDDSADRKYIQQVVKTIRALLARANEEAGKVENRLSLLELDRLLVFRNVEAVVRRAYVYHVHFSETDCYIPVQDLRLKDGNRELLHKGQLRMPGGNNNDLGDLSVFLFDHALLMAIAKKKNQQYHVYRRVGAAR